MRNLEHRQLSPGGLAVAELAGVAFGLTERKGMEPALFGAHCSPTTSYLGG
jgi:hypothetical protein